MQQYNKFPAKQGLYDPIFEKDNCGVGFVANINGEKSYGIVKKALKVLVNLTHRGAVGSDPKTGDGAGIMVQIPDEFFRITCDNMGIELPSEGKYAVGMTFLPKEPALRLQCEGIFERIIEEEGQKLLGWRNVPTDNKNIGETAKGTEPIVRQIFVGSTVDNNDDFERKLYVIRRRADNEVKKLLKRGSEYFYICSLSSKTIVYKGLLLADQIKDFYVDLNNINFKSSIAIVHQRYSTNTFPTWDLAQPFRFIAHNGEINTIRGNRNWMKAREGVLKSKVLGQDIKKLFPIINPAGSDSESLDNMLELLVMDGRSVQESLMMLIPEAWQGNPYMDSAKKAYYEYHSTMVEPWDGPAAVVFTDGVRIGATLDRNGLRPLRYVVTKDGLVTVASEAGVLHFKDEGILEKGKVMPGKMFFVDTKRGIIVNDDKLKKDICEKKNYEDVIKKNKITLDMLKDVNIAEQINTEILKEKQMAFGYTKEDINKVLIPMAEQGKEPVGSMGNDTPLAVLSNKSQCLFSYFKQLFAQVTNPPIDPIRESLVMSLKNYIGPQMNILDHSLSYNPYIEINSPILTDEEMLKIKNLKDKNFITNVIPITFKYDTGIEGFKEALDKICERALKRVNEGYNIIVLSDKTVDSYEAAIPSLLAVSAVQHYLVNEKKRTKVSIVVETGEVRETMHAALLIGYGATAINPYLAFESIRAVKSGKEFENNYVKALNAGILKILSKMGISTIQSYRSAQIFEAIGLSSEFVDKYFEGTSSRIEGAGIDEIAKETLDRHKRAFNNILNPEPVLESGGVYSYRKDGEFHLFNPDTIGKLQDSAIKNDYKAYKEYSDIVNDQSKNLCTIRGLFKLKFENEIPIDEVEPVSEILKRFCAGAMSFGALSKEAHETIAIAMNRIGGRSNCGEGGEDPERYKSDDDKENKRSAVKQVASGRFGVTTDYLVNADEIQIKIAQGAKPGEGGQLPGNKVDKTIARIRHSLPGIDLISPPPHHDIYSIEDLSQLIFDLKSVNSSAAISVKLASEAGVGTIAAGVAKAHADLITICGGDGGTGACPLSSMRHAGVPWELGLSETQQVLLLNNLRSRVRIQTDGQMKTGRDVVIAALLGSEEFGFGTSLLITIGCKMIRHCQKNTCVMGVATQNSELRKNFGGKPEYIINYLTFVAKEVREYMAKLGFRTVNEMIGRVDKIESKDAVQHWKANKLDLSNILYKPDMPRRIKPYCTISQDHCLDKSLDYKLIEIAKPTIENKQKVSADFEIKNTNRAVGAMLSGTIAQKYGESGLKDDTVVFRFKGSAGQSFGAFGVKGLTLILEGEANDYVCKSLSGAHVIIKKPEECTFKAQENIIAGNTILYGATSGKLFVNGIAGERFAVRNSGAEAVCEGVGDHGCEYMTGGCVAILGNAGRNFAAGMSGGTAYIFENIKEFKKKCNMNLVEVSTAESEEDFEKIKQLVEEHYSYTNSSKAKYILDNYDTCRNKFIKVIPTAYKNILEKQKKQK